MRKRDLVYNLIPVSTGLVVLSYITLLTIKHEEASELSGVLNSKEVQVYSDDSKISKREDNFPIIEDRLIIPEYILFPNKKIFVIKPEELSNYRILRREEKTIKKENSIGEWLKQKQHVYTEVLREVLTEIYDLGKGKIEPDSFYIRFPEPYNTGIFTKRTKDGEAVLESLVDIEIYKCKKK